MKTTPKIRYLTLGNFCVTLPLLYDKELRQYAIDSIMEIGGYSDEFATYLNKKHIGKCSENIPIQPIFDLISKYKLKDGWYKITQDKDTFIFVVAENYVLNIGNEYIPFKYSIEELEYLERIPREDELKALRNIPIRFINKKGKETLHQEIMRLSDRELHLNMLKSELDWKKEDI